MKRLTPKYLKGLVAEVIKEERTRRKNPASRYSVQYALYEAKDEEKEDAAEGTAEATGVPGGVAIVNKMTDINDLDIADAWTQLSSGNEEMPLIKAMRDATGWASGAIDSAGGAPAIKKFVEDLGEAEFKKRVQGVIDALPEGAPAKPDMPALEGQDAEVVKDALSPGGEFNVDLSADYAGGTEDFDHWFNALSDEEKEEIESGKAFEKKNESASRSGTTLREDKFPRYGMGAMPGAQAKGEKEDPISKRKDLSDKALAFLTKGKLDGVETDDEIAVNVGGTLQNNRMKPTQSNILAAKSLLFAFLHHSPKAQTDLTDMGGAFVTSENEILDGHHRWSGAYIATGGKQQHGNINVVQGKAPDLIPLLVSVGNAIGRKQKGVKQEDELSESRIRRRRNELSRWQKLAGI